MAVLVTGALLLPAVGPLLGPPLRGSGCRAISTSRASRPRIRIPFQVDHRHAYGGAYTDASGGAAVGGQRGLPSSAGGGGGKLRGKRPHAPAPSCAVRPPHTAHACAHCGPQSPVAQGLHPANGAATSSSRRCLILDLRLPAGAPVGRTQTNSDGCIRICCNGACATLVPSLALAVALGSLLLSIGADPVAANGPARGEPGGVQGPSRAVRAEGLDCAGRGNPAPEHRRVR